ncbi:MAG: HupE/UreJ family protein [Paracoccaceae bacterium]
MPSKPFVSNVLAFALWLVIVIFAPTSANAHAQGYISFEIDVNLEEILAKAQLGENADPAALAAQIQHLRQLRSRALQNEFSEHLSDFMGQIVADTDKSRKDVVERDVDVPGIGDVTQDRITTLKLSVELGLNVTEMSLALPPELGPVTLRVLDKDDAIAHTFLMENGVASQSVPIENLVTIIPFKGKTFKRRLHVIQHFIVVGFEHIVPKGLDHILFVVGLFLLSTRLHPLLIQITSFTLAHTLSLALAVLGIVTVSPAIVEPLIALSIVYVSVENILLRKLSKWRPALVFAFGLLHGLGFAGILAQAQLPEPHFVAGLISFNVGVEIGQLTVIALCFLTVGFWFGRRPWYRQRITVPASIIVGLIGMYWFVERVFIA